MSENANGMAVEFDVKHAQAYGSDGEGQRFARVALCNIATCLSGITIAQADAMREEYCRKWPKAKVEADRMKSRGTDDSMLSTARWPAEIVPPLLREFNQAADLIFKLRKLGVLTADTRLNARFDDVERLHAEKYAGRG